MEPAPSRTTEVTVRGTLIVVGIVAPTLLIAWIAYRIADVLLLIFGAILLAVLLERVAAIVGRWTGWSRGACLGLTILTLVSMIVGMGWFLGSEIVAQFDELAQSLDESVRSVERLLRETVWGRWLVSQANVNASLEEAVSSRSGWLRGIGSIFSSTIGFFGGLIVFAFLALYLSISPEVYRRGMVRLFPINARPRADQIMKELGEVLSSWLGGRFLTMSIVGVLTAIGLWFLNIPLVAPLSVIAFALSFVPYIGPIASAVPAVLIATTASGGLQSAAHVAVLYLLIQLLESYLIQPLVQRRAVGVPPAMLLAFQVVAGVLLGIPGVILATPLLVAGQLLVKRVYLEDVLGEQKVGE